MRGLVLANLAELMICSDDPATGAALAEEAYALRRGLGDRSGMAHAALRAAEAAILGKRFAEGQAYLRESLSLAEELGNAALTCEALRIAVLLATVTGAPAVARRLARVEGGRRSACGEQMTPVRRERYDALLAQTGAADKGVPGDADPHPDLVALLGPW